MDDATLVAGALRGDADAWGAVYDRYADRLHDHCWSILRDEHEAADALHDAFVSAARALPQLRDPNRLRPWLYAIARNEAFRRHRARGRAVPTEDIDVLGELGTVTVDLEHGSGAPVDDLRQLVWDAAGGLSADDQALLDLHLRQGLDGQDLAEAAGVPASNVYVKMSRLRDTMERSLGALLVARTGRTDCPELSGLLADWDGRLTPLLRKRVARHVDECEVCGERKRTMVSPLALFAGVPVVPAPPTGREKIVADAVAAARVAPPADVLFPALPATPPATPPRGGPPVAAGPGGGPPWGWIAAGVAAAIVLAVALALALGGDDDDVATGDSTTTTEEATTTSSSSTTTSSSTTSSTSSTTSTTAPGAVALSTTDLDLGTTAGSAQFQVRNSGGAPVSYALTTSRFLGLNRRTGTLQPGASHTVVVSLDRAGAPEGDFSGSVRLDAGDSGTGAVGVTAVIAARPPALGEVSTTEPNVYTSAATSCPDTDVVVTFSDESPVTGVLTFRSTSFPDGEVAMAVADGRATATFERPPTLELITYAVTLTDSLGATVTTEQRTIEARPSC